MEGQPLSALGSINSGLGSLTGLRWLDRHSADIQRSLERLATGKRINRASDDPSGAIAAERLTGEHRVLEKRLAGLEQRSLRLNALDGSLSVVSDLLVDLQFTVVSAANTGGLTRPEREALQDEADSILQTLDHLKQTSVYKGEFLLQGAFDGQTGAVWFEQQLDDNADPAASPSKTPKLLGLDALRRGGAFDLLSGDLEKAQEVVNNAVDSIASRRAATGAVMRTLESEQQTTAIQLENVAGARSAILDTDYAAEVGSLVRSQVLQQAAIFAVMTARKLSAQNALALLG